MTGLAWTFLAAWLGTAGYSYYLFEDRELLMYVISGMMKEADDEGS